MTPSLTDTLCTRCGLCCDGSLFSDVELSGRSEATRLELLGLDIEEDDADESLLQQPCAALRGTRCGIYAHRPGCCMTFECRLLRDVRRGAMNVARARGHIADARQRIRRTKVLLVRLGQRHNVPIIHIVRRVEQAQVVRARGGVHVLNSSDPDFVVQLRQGVVQELLDFVLVNELLR